MAAFSAAFGVFLLFNTLHGLNGQDDKRLVWPEEYHITGELTEYHTGVELPIEIWYSEEYRRSRVDVGGNIVSHFYDLETEDTEEATYGIHPVADNSSLTSEWKCYKPCSRILENLLLPATQGFTYAGQTETLYARDVEVWTKISSLSSSEENVISRSQTLLVTNIGGNYSLPAEYVEIVYSSKRGNIEHTVIHYKTYDTKFTEAELIVPVPDQCSGINKTRTCPLLDGSYDETVRTEYWGKQTEVNMNRDLKLENDDLPPSFDLREKGLVSAVKNQGGHCYSSWAFAIVAALEATVAFKTGKLFDFSEQALIDCSWEPGNEGCQGGWPRMGAEFIRIHGIPEEKDYGGYKGIDSECNMDEDGIYFRIQGITNLDSNEAIKAALNQYGAVVITIHRQSLKEYTHGILKQTDKHPESEPVVVVGYGNVNGEEYFTVKNSWGENWGEAGYMRISTNNSYYDPFAIDLLE